MRTRAIALAGASSVALLLVAGWGAVPAPASTTCTWGGTPLAPTGWFKQSPGVTNTPSTEPAAFTATGPLAGGCSGTLTYRGYSAAGATCAFGPFEAKATGLPGVVRAAGDNIVGLVPALLYDKAGNVVGSENPQLLTDGTEERNFLFTDCNTPEGFKEGHFSSVIELFD
jgi:hypothetical protein